MVKKNIVLFSTGDVNGAYEAIYRLTELLNEIGHNAVMVVKDRTKADNFIIKYHSNSRVLIRLAKKVYTRIIKKPSLHTKPEYSFESKDEINKNVNYTSLLQQIPFNPDYIFTGMTINFLNSTDLMNIQKLTNAQIYNLTVDMNHFTGGCHFSWGCDGYMTECKNCPAIIDPKQKSVAEINFKTKVKNAKKANFKIIAGSGLTLEQAKLSLIYKNQDVIHNVNSLIDTKLFNAKNRNIAKEVFNLDTERFYILAGSQSANDKRKGHEYLIDALEKLQVSLDEKTFAKLTLLVVARDTNLSFEKLNIDKQRIDYVKDYRLLALLYQACDLYVNSSVEDSGPMMVSEALACGTPVVGFDTGVVTNMVLDDYNGYKAENKNATQLAEAIKRIILLKPDQKNEFSQNAVRQVEEYSSFEYLKTILNQIIQ